MFERFWKGSLRGLYERSIYERTFLSKPIENHAISNELSNVNHVKKHLHKHYRVFRRDREPSRIPIRTLERLRNKNRKVREFVYKGIRSYTPKSPKVHCYVKVKKQRNKAKLLFKGSGKIHKSIIKLKKRASRYLSLFSPNRLCLYKSQAHAANYCKFKLVSDIEKNPGPTPMHVDSSKTIAAPYGQGNELVFGQNAGQQCVAMSLCSLLYNTRQSISSARDLINIMNIGNQLYSSFSQLARQSYLMQTELPIMLNVFQTDYQLEYSDSYSGTVHRETIIEGYQCCTLCKELLNHSYLTVTLILY